MPEFKTVSAEILNLNYTIIGDISFRYYYTDETRMPEIIELNGVKYIITFDGNGKRFYKQVKQDFWR